MPIILRTVHRKYIWQWKKQQIMSFSPKISSPIFSDTLKMYLAYALIHQIFPTDSFYLYGSPKFSPAKYFPCTTTQHKTLVDLVVPNQIFYLPTIFVS